MADKIEDPGDWITPGGATPASSSPPIPDPGDWITPKPAPSGASAQVNDVLKSGGQGLVHGAEGVPGFLGDVERGGKWLMNQATKPADYGLLWAQGWAADKLGKLPPGETPSTWATKKLGELNDMRSGLNAMPSTGDIKAAGESVGVPDYHPQTTAGKYAYSVGTFVPGALAGGETTAAGLAKYALAPGVTSEALGNLYEGTSAEPWARLVGGLLPGAALHGGQLLRAGKNLAADYTRPARGPAGVEATAGGMLRDQFLDPDKARAALEAAQTERDARDAARGAVAQSLGQEAPAPTGFGENVEGSKPTTGQLTGDLGALSAERQIVTRDPHLYRENEFGTGASQQNAARTAALQGLQPTGSPSAVGDALRSELSRITDAGDQAVANATADARAQASRIGSGAAPEDVGEAMRGALREAADAEKKRTSDLFAAVDPDGTLTMPTSPLAAAASKIADSVSPLAKPMAGEEAAIFAAAGDLPRLSGLKDVLALRSRVSDEMRQELSTQGQTATYARLSALRGKIEDAIVSAAEHKAAQNGAEAGIDVDARAGNPIVQGSGLSGVSGRKVSNDVSAGAAPMGADEAGTAGQGNAQLRTGSGLQNVPGDVARPDREVLGPGRVYHPSGSLDVHYELREAPDLITSHDTDFRANPAFPPELQPRERSAAPAQDQVNSMAARLEPERLGRSPEANSGAPIIGPDGVVESGNGRTLAIRKAYAAGKGEAYRTWLEKQGVDTSGFKQPVLVARRTTELTPEDRVAFAHGANTSSGLAMTDAEKAFSDAKLVTPSVLSALEDAPIASGTNREFVRNFLKQLSASERGDLLGKEGSLSQKGIRRVELAMLAKAFGDPEFIDRAFVSPDLNVRNLAGALVDASPAWAKMREAARTGAIDAAHDVTPDLMTAVRGALRAKAEGRNVADVLNNGDLFGSEASNLAKGLILKPNGSLASREEIAERLGKYAQEAQKNLAGPNLFGDTVDPLDVLRNAARAREEAAGASGASSGAAAEPESVSAALKPPPEPTMDAGAVGRLKTATEAYKGYAQTYKRGPVGQALKRGQTADTYGMAASSVPGQFFARGPAGAERVGAYRAATPKMEPLLDAAAESLRRFAIGDDGILNPDKFKAWRAQHQDALRGLPTDLSKRFESAAAASELVEQASAARKAAIDDFQKSAAGRIAGLTSDRDIVATVGSIFGRNDGVRRMTDLARRMQGDPNAVEGLRKAVAEHILQLATGTTENGSSGIANLNASAFQKFVRDKRDIIKAAGFNDRELGSMQAIAADMQRSQRTLQATKLPGQSNTAQDFYGHMDALVKASHGSLLMKIIGGALAGGEHMGHFGAPLGALGGLSEHFIAGRRMAGLAEAGKLVRDAMLNPELALELLKKAPSNNKDAGRAAARLLMKNAMFSAMQAGRENARAQQGR